VEPPESTPSEKIRVVIQADPDSQARMLSLVDESCGNALTVILSADSAWKIAQALCVDVKRK